ncbi:Vgb family protein [Rhizobium sp. LjRoot258]|uniref:Vgb family protein n=1 Tax=Rhizobium sp. LjRoot258 TaxID=3342299 RepID=UPI003ECC789C
MKSASVFFLSILFAAATNLDVAQADEPAMAHEKQELKVQAKILRRGDFIAFGFGSVWMMSGNHLGRFNPADNSTIDIPVEGAIGPYRGIATGERAVWVPDIESKTIFKIDPQANRVVMRIPADLSDSEGSIGVGAGAVWVVTMAGKKITSKDYNRELSRFNAATGVLEATLQLPARGAAAIFDHGSVWVTGFNKNELYRVDPVTNRVVATIALRERPRFLASGEGSVWVVNQGDGTVQRIDARSNELMATIETGAAGGGGDIAVGGGFTWVTSREWPVIKIDAKNNQLVGTFHAPRDAEGMGDAIRYGAGSVWVSGTSLFRIDPSQ